MGVFEIISAIVLIIACVFIVVVILMKDTKTQMSQSISGTSSDSFYQKNAGRTKEAILNRATVVAAIIFFVLALAVNVINVYWNGSKVSADSGSDTQSVVSDTSDDSTDSSDSSENSSDSSEDSSDSSEDSSDSSEDSSEDSPDSSEDSDDSGENPVDDER